MLPVVAADSAGEVNAEAISPQVFVALSDPTRRSILSALATGGPATATDLAGRIPISRQAVAKHLVLLSDAGLVTSSSGERRRIRFQGRSLGVADGAPRGGAAGAPMRSRTTEEISKHVRGVFGTEAFTA